MKILILLFLYFLKFVSTQNLPPLFGSSMAGTLVISSVNDQLRFAAEEPAIPWQGFTEFARNPKPPLYGVTYFPWRTVEDCSNVTESDIESDIRTISQIANSIYIYELFCDFGPLLVNLTRHHNMSILIGLGIKNESEYQRQRQVLHEILTSNMNLSHVVAISVGHSDLGSILNGINSTTAVAVFEEKLRNITAMVDLSEFPNIPVSTADLGENLFRRRVNKQEQVYIGIYNPMENQKDPKSAAMLLYEGLINIRNLDEDDDYDEDMQKKPIIVMDIGWPSDGYYDFNLNKKGYRVMARNRTLITQTDQFYFYLLIRCPRYTLPPMYYVNSAFDLTWKYKDENDSAAYWGLADAVTRQLKPSIQAAFYQYKCEDAVPTNPDLNRRDGGKNAWTPILIGICSVLAVIFIIMLVLLIWFWRWKRDAVRKLKRTQIEQMEYFRNCSTTSAGEESNRYVKDVTKFNSRWDDYLDMLEPDYEDLSYMVAPDLRIDLSQLELKEIIGEGHFGVVQKAKFYRGNVAQDVAVKRLHVGARNVHQFLMEGIKMQKFNHPNVLNLIGISFTPTNMPMIITPYLAEGDLLDYIRNPENKKMPLRRIVDFCYQIAEGMRYLHELKMIHRDLAARNCMLDKELTVKIADFGLCRDISDNDSYQTTKAFELPIRWMPPEAIEKLQWTSKSDVWSYGVVMWELLTRGQQPYSDVPLIELRAYLKSGGRLNKPEGCPDIMYEIMKSCWTLRTSSRPEFSDLAQTLPILLQALDRGKNADDNEYYNIVMPLLISRKLSSDQQLSPPQSPASVQSFSMIDKPKGHFARTLMTWSMPKRLKRISPTVEPKERKQSLP